MRDLFIQSAFAGLTASSSFAPNASPFLAMEHVNLNAPSWTLEMQKFWVDGLGFTLDPRAKEVCTAAVRSGGTMKGLVWANIGLQQIHMPLGEPEDTTQNIRGTVGLAYADVASVRNNLSDRGIKIYNDDGGFASDLFGPAFQLASPTGVKLRVHSSIGPFGPAEAASAGLAHLPGGPSAGVGIPYVEFECARGSAAGICRFYEETLGVSATSVPGRCVVPIQNQLLIFEEKDKGLPPYDGHHVAIYVGDISSGDYSKSFADMYKRCSAQGLIYNNPRFPHLRYDKLEDALRHGEFRILELVDPKTGSPAYTLEHEIRSLEHSGFSCKSLIRQVPTGKQVRTDAYVAKARGCSPHKCDSLASSLDIRESRQGWLDVADGLAAALLGLLVGSRVTFSLLWFRRWSRMRDGRH